MIECAFGEIIPTINILFVTNGSSIWEFFRTTYSIVPRRFYRWIDEIGGIFLLNDLKLVDFWVRVTNNFDRSPVLKASNWVDFEHKVFQTIRWVFLSCKFENIDEMLLEIKPPTQVLTLWITKHFCCFVVLFYKFLDFFLRFCVLEKVQETDPNLVKFQLLHLLCH